jgi:uncharacterized protein (DUF1697 family)
MSNSITYAAFLRGINVGGHMQIKMADLVKLFESLGFENVRTLLNSGNIIFDSSEVDENKLTKIIVEGIEKFADYKIIVMLRSIDDIKKIIKLDPFKNITVTKDTRLYASFLAQESDSQIKLPFFSEQKDLYILSKTSREVFYLVDLSKSGKTTEAMKIMEKEFGKASTTRNWNTVKKVAALVS